MSRSTTLSPRSVCCANRPHVISAERSIPYEGKGLSQTPWRALSMTFVKALARGTIISLVLSTSACLNGTELVSLPYQPPSTITFVFHPDSADAATASALGWSAGIPGIEITLIADSTNSAPQVFQGSDSGTLALDQLPAGVYSVSAVRLACGLRAGQTPAWGRCCRVYDSIRPDCSCRRRTAARRNGGGPSARHRY